MRAQQSSLAAIGTSDISDSPTPSDRTSDMETPDRDRPLTPTQPNTPPEQSHPATAEMQIQQGSQSQSAAPEQSDRDLLSPTASSDRTPPEQPHSAAAETQTQQELQLQSATPDQERSPNPSPEFPEWMTARQAFESLGGDPGDRDSSVSSADGLKQIKFSTFKSKTSSELKPFGLELSQDRKLRRQGEGNMAGIRTD